MNILIYVEFAPPVYLGGGEQTLWSFAKHMQKKGHRIRLISLNQKKEILENIATFPLSEKRGINNQTQQYLEPHFKWAHLIWTQLSRADEAIHYAQLWQKPLLQLVYGTAKLPFKNALKLKHGIVYNSKSIETHHHIFDYAKNDHNSFYTIIRPIVKAEAYSATHKGQHLTLINQSENKGGWPFYQLVKKHPDWSFLAVKGAYQLQVFTQLEDDYYLMQKYSQGPIDAFFALNRNRVIKDFKKFKLDLKKFGAYGYTRVEKPANLKFKSTTSNMVSVYNDTEILLIMSKTETWGRVASEAMCNGIPVIYAHTPGLKEQIEEAGICIKDRDDLEAWSAAIAEVKANYDYWSAKAKQRFKDLDLPKDLDRLEKICEALLSDNPPSRRVFIE